MDTPNEPSTPSDGFSAKRLALAITWALVCGVATAVAVGVLAGYAALGQMGKNQMFGELGAMIVGGVVGGIAGAAAFLLVGLPAVFRTAPRDRRLAVMVSLLFSLSLPPAVLWIGGRLGQISPALGINFPIWAIFCVVVSYWFAFAAAGRISLRVSVILAAALVCSSISLNASGERDSERSSKSAYADAISTWNAPLAAVDGSSLDSPLGDEWKVLHLERPYNNGESYDFVRVQWRRMLGEREDNFVLEFSKQAGNTAYMCDTQPWLACVRSGDVSIGPVYKAPNSRAYFVDFDAGSWRLSGTGPFAEDDALAMLGSLRPVSAEQFVDISRKYV